MLQKLQAHPSWATVPEPQKRPTHRALDYPKEAIGAEQHPSSSHR